MRIAILGNAASGKSTLSGKLSADHGLPHIEVDRFLWGADWQPAAPEDYTAAHDAALAGDGWVIDGMGRRDSLAPRLDRATHVILCDFPIWQTFWLLAERQEAWANGTLANPPGGRDARPPTRDLFKFVFEIDQTFMPVVRDLVAGCDGVKPVYRIPSFEALQDFTFP